MLNYFSISDGSMENLLNFGASIYGNRLIEKTNNTSDYMLTTSDSWSVPLTGLTSNTNINSIAVHLSSRSSNPVGVLSATIENIDTRYVIKSNITPSSDSPFGVGTDSSLSFNGSTSYMFVSSQSYSFNQDIDVEQYNEGYTLEFWAKFPASGNAHLDRVIQIGNSNDQYSLMLFLGNAASNAAYLSLGGTAVYTISNTTIAVNDNTWHHIALTRKYNITRLFIDGIQVGSTTTRTSYYLGFRDGMIIGASNRIGGNATNFSISNIRITKTCLYDANFTAPTSPLTVLPKTSFLYKDNYGDTYTNNYSVNSVTNIYPISSFTYYNEKNYEVSNIPLNWQLLKLNTPFNNYFKEFRFNLKTSDPNQLSLMGTNTVSGIDYDRMIISDDIVERNYTFTRGTNSYIHNDTPFNDSSESTCLLSIYNANQLSLFRNSTLSDINFKMGGAPFTAEGFFKFNGVTNNINIRLFGAVDYIASSKNGWEMTLSAGYVRFGNYQSSSVPAWTLTSSTQLIQDTWYHIAVANEGNSSASNRLRIFLNGQLDGTSTAAVAVGVPSVVDVQILYTISPSTTAFASNIRVIKNKCLYTSNFTPPNTNLNGYIDTTNNGFTVCLLREPYDYTVFESNVPMLSTSGLHIGGNINGYSTETRTITAATGNVPNISIHKNGTLAFPSTSSVSLSVVGNNGIQLTSEGSIQIGTSSNPIPSNITHQILLSSHLAINNRSSLNSYGAYKLPYAKFSQDYTSPSSNFITVESLSTSWQAGDNVIILPNSTASNTTEIFTINSFSNEKQVIINGSTVNSHPVISYLPNIANLTRNVKIGGFSTTLKGSLISLNNSNINLNNTQLQYIDNEIINRGSDNITISGCTLSAFNDVVLLSSLNSNTNSKFSNNVLYKTKHGLYLNNLSSSNISIDNNLFVNSLSSGLYINGLNTDLNLTNNIVMGSSLYGTLLENNLNNKRIEGIINFNNNNTGLFINGNHTGIINNIINTHNTIGGVYINAATSNVSSTTFSNITASNNKTVGFIVSGNSINHLTPVILNINGLVANSNLSGGFEGYCIAGNLSSILLSANGGNYQIKTSIGNYYTTFDGITALTNNVSNTSAAIGILSGINYYPTVIKNSNIGKAVGSSIFGAAISLDSTKFSQFSVYNSTVSGGSSDFQLKTSKNILEGSYLISNTNVGTLPVGVGITNSNYQHDVLKTTGFAFTNMNNASGYNVTYLAAGSRQIDSTTTCNINESTSPSERLTPQSTTIKLRSGSKFVALNSGESAAINVYVRKSTLATNGAAYNGNSPRLMLKRNGAAGINSDIVMDQLDTTSENFLKLGGVSPAVTDDCVLEFYIDCDGTQGWINIDNWTAN